LGDRRRLAEQIVAEVASGLSRSESQLSGALGRSLASFQAELPRVDHVVAEMLQAGLLREEVRPDRYDAPPRLRATRLGHIATRHFLEPSTVGLFHRALALPQEWTYFDLLLLAASSEDAEPILPVDFEEIDEMGARLEAEPSYLMQQTRSEVVSTLEIDGKRLLAAMKVALVARGWTRLGDTHAVASGLGCYPFEVDRVQESLERLLLAMGAIAKPPDETAEEVARLDAVTPSKRLEFLRQMVSAGLDEKAATLALLSGVGAVLARRFTTLGIGDLEDLANAELDDIANIKGISRARLKRLIEEAGPMLKATPIAAFADVGPQTEVVRSGWPSTVDPYRLRRALDLTVNTRGSKSFTVAGGLEPHVVEGPQRQERCDCRDALRGSVCKHVLAVRLRRGDDQLKTLARRLAQKDVFHRIDLFDLWMSAPASHRTRRTA
jgi:helicase